ncbi:hypothetical protein KA005_65000 [bacterium]|nr:hypothetical protein [bacterium]
MANEILQKQGTDIVWTSSGGDEVLTLTSLANNTGRAGDEHDFGATFPSRVRIELEIDPLAAPTAGLTFDVYWSSSKDGTKYDGECTGSDAAYSSEDDVKRLKPVGSLPCSKDTDPQIDSWVYFLPARYGLPVIFNKSGQVLTATGTDQIVTVTPLIDEIQ